MRFNLPQRGRMHATDPGQSSSTIIQCDIHMECKYSTEVHLCTKVHSLDMIASRFDRTLRKLETHGGIYGFP